MTKGNCTVLKANEYAHEYVGSEQSGCFYFASLDLSSLPARSVARAARIEVRDTDDALHQHRGAVVAFITAGNGMFKTKEGDIPVRTGDTIYIPPMTPHLSLADKGTVMIEHIVYLGAKDDWQESLKT